MKHKTEGEGEMCKKLPQHSFAETLHSLQLSSFFLFLLLNCSYQATAYVLIYGGCSQAKYLPGSLFQSHLNSLLSFITTSSTQSSYNSFTVGNGSSLPADAALYGLYQCRSDLSKPSCTNCIENAVSQLALVCTNGYTGTIQLDGCLVRYDNVNFLGKLDTMLEYKKCSKSSSNEGEFFQRRDDVLAELETGDGFRVRSVGTVEGFGQCVGDLNGDDCSTCLAEAVQKLKTMCGSSVAGDVFLSKCYARYWASGYYSSNDPADTSDDDELGKTVAIIVGVLAGVALFIVLLSFLKKVSG